MNAYPDARWVGMRFTFEFIDQEAREDATPSASPGDEASQLEQVVDDQRSLDPAYEALEQNRWGLGKPFAPLPDKLNGVHTGYIYGAQSRSDCTFATNPYLDFRFTEPHSSIGFTINFEESTGAHATVIQVTTYNAQGQIMASQTVENHCAVAVIKLLSPDYQRVRFEFRELSRPLARLRVAEVLFGIIESYDPDTIAEATLSYEVDPIAESLPARECVVRIDNSNQRFNIINPAGIYAYLQQPQAFHVSLGIGAAKSGIEYVSMGDFFFASASAEDASLTAEIVAYDWLYWLENGTFRKTGLGTWTLEEAVAEILANAGISCDVAIQSGKETTHIQIVEDAMTNREALRQAVQAARCTAYFDRTGTLVIGDLAEAAPVDVLNSDNLCTPPGITRENAVNTVTLTTRDFGGQEVVYTASNREPGETQQVKAFTNYMVTPGNGPYVAQWLLQWCQGRITYTTQERGNPATKLADTVQIYDYFHVNRNGIIRKQTYKYDGGLSAESEAISRGT